MSGFDEGVVAEPEPELELKSEPEPEPEPEPETETEPESDEPRDLIPSEWCIADELEQLGLGPTGCGSLRSLEPHVVAERLESFQSLLQSGKGGDGEWVAALSARDFALVDELLAVCANERHSAFLAASRCLAFSGNVYRRMWIHYVVDDQHLEAVCRAAQVGARHCLRALRDIREEKQQPLECANYLGFDRRDIALYNLSADYDVPSPASAKRRSSTHGIVGMEEVDDLQAAILVWLLLLFQFFGERNNFLCAVLRGYAQAVDESDSLGNEPPPPCLAFSTLAYVCESLLRSCAAFSEDAYLQAVRVLAAINRHCCACPSEDGTTLVVKRCGLQVHGVGGTGEDGSAVHTPATTDPSLALSPTSPPPASPAPSHGSISEGLMHILNDCGFPAHASPETLPILQLCIDLVSYVSENNIFYTNDLNVCADIIVRELTNISAPHDSSSSGDGYDEEVRVMYLRLTGAVLSYHVRKQLPADELYRGAELRLLVAGLAESGQSARMWSREEAAEVLELFDALC